MNQKSKEHLENALFHLKEKIKTTNSSEILEKITDCMIELAAFIENCKEENE
jgi:hypothetical protein